MSVSGWVALIAGSLSALFSSLAYTKNLHDAATAPTAREFLGNVQQMKENSVDGTTGLMSILGGKGGIKMGKGFNMQNIVNAMKPGNLLKSLKGGLKGAGNKIAGMAKSIGAGMTKLFQGGLKAFKSFGAKLKKLFSKKKTDLTPDQIKKNSVSSQKANGHTYERMPDGQVASCSHCSLTRKKYEAELKADTPEAKQVKQDLDALETEMNAVPDGQPIPDDLMKRQLEIEARLDTIKNRNVSTLNIKDKLANGESIIIPPPQKGFKQWFNSLTPDELDLLWKIPGHKKRIKSLLRLGCKFRSKSPLKIALYSPLISDCCF